MARPAVEIGPQGIRTQTVTVPNRYGEHLRGLVHRPPPDVGSAGVVLVTPGLGTPLRRTLPVALQLVTDGFTAVRFVSTNSVGASDGSIRDFTLTRVAEDLCDLALWAREAFGVSGVGVHAASIAGRAALRAAASRPQLFPVVVTVGCVVDVAATLRAIRQGEDVVEQWRSMAEPDPDRTDSLLGHRIRLRSLQNLVQEDWATLDSTVRDLRAAPCTRFVDVHGAADDWVDLDQVVTAFAAAPRSKVVVLDGVGHEPELEVALASTGRLLPEYRSVLAPLRPPGAVPPPVRTDVLLRQRAMDRHLETHLTSPCS